jgi:hypothetical protein
LRFTPFASSHSHSPAALLQTDIIPFFDNGLPPALRLLDNNLDPRTPERAGLTLNRSMTVLREFHNDMSRAVYYPTAVGQHQLPPTLMELASNRQETEAWRTAWFNAMVEVTGPSPFHVSSIGASKAWSQEWSLGMARTTWQRRTDNQGGQIVPATARAVPSYRIRCPLPDGAPEDITLHFLRLRGHAGRLLNYSSSPPIHTHPTEENKVFLTPITLTLPKGTHASQPIVLDPHHLTPHASQTPNLPPQAGNNPILPYFQLQQIDGLLPIEMQVANRDDPAQKWSDSKYFSSSEPIYAGESCGDMVSWKLGGTDSWDSTVFTWTAEGPSGETKTGPTGVGKNEWRIADGDADLANDWLKWKPGKWKIKVQIGSIQTEFEQQVGWRTESHLVIGQIIETHTHDGDSPPLIAVGNNPWEISSPVALFRRAVVYDIAAWLPSNSIRDAVTIAPAPITAFLSEAWFGYWGFLKSHDSTPKGPFVSSHLFGFGTVEYKHRYWMTQHMLNLGPDQPLAPPQIAESSLSQTQQEEQFRIMHRYQAKFTLDDFGKIKTRLLVGTHIADKGITKIGWGIEENQLWDGSPSLGPWQLLPTESETNELLNGKESVSTDGIRISGFATGRIGEKGRNANWRLFGKDAPWIFSEIVFEVKSDRTVETTHRTSVDISWRDGSVVQGNKQFNNLNIYKGIQQRRQDGSFVITYQREGLLEMEGKLEPFINSASGQWPEPNISPLIQ